MKAELISKTVKAYLKRVNKNSKWFAQDLATFKAGIAKETPAQLIQRLSNWCAMDDENSTFNKAVKAEEKRMDKAGLFNVRNMKPVNALD